jgi:hypothetical protein
MMTGMIPLILTGLLRMLRTRQSLVLENLALRHQLAVVPVRNLIGASVAVVPRWVQPSRPKAAWSLGRCEGPQGSRGAETIVESPHCWRQSAGPEERAKGGSRSR